MQPWILSGDSAYRRVVSLFIVPYQGSKGLTGAGDEIPVIGFASFYVMNWTGANNNQSDPCPDRTWGATTIPDPPKGAITGVFVEAVDYEQGPVDPTATCVEGQLTPCRVTLVRWPASKHASRSSSIALAVIAMIRGRSPAAIARRYAGLPRARLARASGRP